MPMRPSHVEELLKKIVPIKKPVLITGAPGISKTSVCIQVAEQLPWPDEYCLDGKPRKGWHVITDHPVYGDPTDGKGIPWIDNGGVAIQIANTILANKELFSKSDIDKAVTIIVKAIGDVGKRPSRAEYHPAGTLARVIEATEPTMWLMDDFGQADDQVQASYMPALLDREVNGVPIPDCVAMVATSNRRTDNAAVQGLLEPVKSRFVTIVEMEVNNQDFTAWLIRTNQPLELVAYIRFRPGMLLKEDPSKDLKNSPCPRTWYHAGLITRLGLDRSTELEALTGAVGEEAANDYHAYLRVHREMPPLQDVIDNPRGVRMPDSQPGKWAVATGLAHMVTPKNFDSIEVYAQRMYENDGAEFAQVLVNDCYLKDDTIVATPAFRRLLTTPLGRFIQGL